MKDKLSELESQGITPTRDHVLDHLQLIKDISKGRTINFFNKNPLSQVFISQSYVPISK